MSLFNLFTLNKNNERLTNKRVFLLYWRLGNSDEAPGGVRSLRGQNPAWLLFLGAGPRASDLNPLLQIEGRL